MCEGVSNETTYEVPSASAARVGALVAGELVDQDAGVTVVVVGAATATASATGAARGAVGLTGVLEGTSLPTQESKISIRVSTLMRTRAHIPGRPKCRRRPGRRTGSPGRR